MHKKKRILIVDGYNVLGAWRSGMGSMESARMDAARDELTDMLRDYAGYAGQAVILVYDAWLSDRKTRTEETSGPLTVVFTRKGETADQYIERLTDSLAHDISLDKCEVRVATSDSVEQTVILGRGATRLSARELLAEIEHTRSTGRRHMREQAEKGRSTVMERMNEETRRKLESMRRGGK